MGMALPADAGKTFLHGVAPRMGADEYENAKSEPGMQFICIQ